jgi:hypothetical protein
MATYILKRKSYSINPYKVTLSDLAIEFGIKFPEEMKKLAKMEKRIDSDLHHWAMTAPGINTVASPEMMYQSLSAGEVVVPALISNDGQVTLYYNTQSGMYVNGETELKDPQAFVNILISELNKVIEYNNSLTISPEVSSGDVEVIKQELMYYQVYLDNIMMTFNVQPPQPVEPEQPMQ